MVSLPRSLKAPRPGFASYPEESKAFDAGAVHRRRPILAMRVVHGQGVSGGIVLLSQLLGGPDVR
jgi:hypothetical protein